MNKSAWSYYLSFYRNKYKQISIIIILSIMQSIAVFPIIFVVNYLIDTVIPEGNLKTLLYACLSLLGLIFTGASLRLVISRMSINTGAKLLKEIREDLISRYYRLPLDYIKNLDTGKTHTIFLADVDRIGAIANVLISTFLPSLFASCVLAGVLINIEWRLFVLLILLSPIQVIVTRFCSEKIRKKVDLHRKSFQFLAKKLWFVLSMAELTRQQNAEATELREQQNNLDEYLKRHVDMDIQKADYGVFQNFITGFCGIITLFTGSYLISIGLISLGELLSFYIGAKFLQTYFNPLIAAIPLLVSGNESLNGVFQLVDTKKSLPYTGTAPINFKGNIRLNNICFSYGSNIVLENASMELAPGKITLLLGPNGSGKSTITNLVMGFYRPGDGFLAAEGIPFDEIKMSDLRSGIAIVPQIPLLFRGSIYENLIYGSNKSTMEEVIECTTKTNAHDFIKNLPNGYNTNLDDVGELISGGEKQLITISRALLRKPKVLILDEPTNHLSDASVNKLLDALANDKLNRTTFIISHECTISKYADEIFKIENHRLNKVY
ncbi:ABC transporter ATP-binding protein [Candidatus Pelagisphaera phototrophica]|uniref:ABC transporter ATP-binding protein n=1 Tax=Candidatus Pelagisphaera phototrophica TaxID=2684113 RepID=UPI0019E10B1E|nr:ABC transporter ATP-binding protein [Candidatus Pelagisphaera phototrophica]